MASLPSCEGCMLFVYKYHTCVFNFTVCADKIGYHMRNGRGCTTLKYHIPTSRTNNLSSKYLPQNITQKVYHMTNC